MAGFHFKSLLDMFVFGLLGRNPNDPLSEFSAMWIKVLVGAGLIIFVLAIGIFAVDSNTSVALTFFGLATLYGIAVAMVGVFVGFLFGVPRVVVVAAEDGSTSKTPSGKSLNTNTNLERISDWLTAAIVAISLTQVGNIGPGLTQIADFAAKIFRDSACPADACNGATMLVTSVAPATAIAMTLIGAVSGFLIGYVSTRVFLARLFHQVEQDLSAFRAAEARYGDELKGAVDQLASPRKASPRVMAAGSQVLESLRANPDVDILATLPNERIKDPQTARTVVDARIAKADWVGAAIALGIALVDAYGQQRADLLARQKLIEDRTKPTADNV
jgi:hypothetical protein